MIDKERWLLSRDVADFLAAHRDNDLRVRVGTELVPLVDVHYHWAADMLILELDFDYMNEYLGPEITSTLTTPTG